jgi:hypothetical protein
MYWVYFTLWYSFIQDMRLVISSAAISLPIFDYTYADGLVIN